MSSYMIAHASSDEYGRANGGAAGDQTGKEVCVRTWYNGNWNVVLRPKSSAVAETMAAAAIYLCEGNLVGYDQYQRNDLWDQLERVGWNYKLMKTKTETDCSAFVTALAKIAGIDVARMPLGNGKYNAPVTQTMRNAFGNTGAFEILTASKYMTTYANLIRGDILVRESGHTAIYVGELTTSGTNTTVNNGSLTSAQVMAMQKYYGVDADGQWGPLSRAAAGGLDAIAAWAKYQAALTAQQTANSGKKKIADSNPYIKPNSLIKQDYVGSAVKWIQYQLFHAGYKVIYNTESAFVDGIFGAATTQAVQKFQKDKGLEVDGIVGPMTIAALEKL